MAGDSKSNISKARRSTYSTTTSSTTTATRSRFSAAANPVQPATSEAGWSNITGFRNRLDVVGSPQSDYFNSGKSKWDRQAGYIGRPLTGSCFVAPNSQPGPVRSPAEYSPREQEAHDSDQDDGGEDDGDTVLPSESVSQVGGGRGRPRERPRGLFGEVGRGGGLGQQTMLAGGGRRTGVQRSPTYPDMDDGAVGRHRQSFGGRVRYDVVERKPQKL